MIEQQPNDHEIRGASERKEHECYHGGTYALFLPKTLSAIAAFRLKHNLSDINSIYEHFTKIEARNAEFYKD